MTTDSVSHSRRIDMGGFVLDAERKTVAYDGVDLAVTERTFDFLWMLGEGRGELVGKNDLIEQLWPDQFVTEASLSRLVSDTRQMLAQYQPDVEFIQTVRGRGFRLRVAVTEASARQVPGPETTPEVPLSSRRTLQAVVVLVVAALTVGIPTLWQHFSEPDTSADSVGPSGGTVLVLPVEVRTGDDQDNWAQYGVMAMLTQQLQAYPRVPVIGAQSAVTGLAQIGYDPAVSGANGGSIDPAMYAHICGSLGCEQLISTTLEIEGDQLVLQYRLYGANTRSPVYRFVSDDALDATEMLSEHLVARLIPDSRERLDLKPFYSDDAIANRNLALGVSSLYHADYAEAKVYLELALQRKPDFLWAQFFSADAAMRMGDIDDARKLLDDLEAEPLSQRQTLEFARLRSNLLYDAGELEASQAASRASIDVARALDDQEGYGMALMNTGTSYTALGNISKAREYIGKAMATFSAHGFALREAQAELNLANAMRVDGEALDVVAGHYRNAAQTFLNCNADTYLAYALRSLGDINRARGRYADAVEQFTRVQEIFQKSKDIEGELFVATDLAMLSMDTGDLAAAETYARHAYDGAGSRFTYLRAFGAALLTHIYLKHGQPEVAAPYLAEMAAHEWFDPRANYALLPASVAHRRGDFAGAVELARGVRSDLGEAWTPAHEQYLSVFEASRASAQRIAFDYYKGTRLD